MPAHRRRIGYVFQEGRLFPHLTVAANLDYGRRMCGLPPDAADTARIVSLLDIGHLLDRRPGKLSGGERQRVAVGRALLMRPRLLLLDEPLASLDAARKREILPYLERLRDEAHVPMVYVSHNRAEMRRIAATVVRIEAGRVVATGGLELLETVDDDLKSLRPGNRFHAKNKSGTFLPAAGCSGQTSKVRGPQGLTRLAPPPLGRVPQLFSRPFQEMYRCLVCPHVPARTGTRSNAG